jgi:acyl-CoA synthetase (AMP-forming)/AMP-acid ligase II
MPNAESFEDAVGELDSPPLPDVDLGPDDDASIMYTSGTTGRPKGAVATQRNFVAHLMNGMYRAAAAAAAAPPPAPGAPPPLPTATLLTFPLFHVGGLQSFLMPYTAAGGKIVLMYKWDAVEAVDLIERENVTAVAGVPTTVFQMLEVAKAQGRDLPSLAGVASGATLVPPELVRRIDDQFASRAAPTNGYGLTETSGAAIANMGKDYVDRPESVGKPISPVMEVKIVDSDGNEAPPGEVGEIWLRGPTVVRGYFNNAEATAASFRDGWFLTGDLGRLDDEGFLYVVDRLKDVIIRGGENIYAAEVEAALYEHPDITEAATIGIPDERMGEEVGAVIRVRDGASISPDEVRAHVAARLASFKVPSRVWIVNEELPRNAAGKVLKRELRETLGATDSQAKG